MRFDMLIKVANYGMKDLKGRMVASRPERTTVVAAMSAWSC